MQVVLVGEVERAAVLGRVVAVKHNTVRQGKGHTGTQVDSAAIVGRIVFGKGCTGQCDNSRIVGIQRRATAVGDAVFDAACALHGKVCVHVRAVGILNLFDFIVAGLVLDRCTIAIQHDIKAAIAVDGGGTLNIHARAGACIMEPANGGIIQSQAAAQRHLRATGGGAVIRCLDGAVLDGELAKHRYADCRIIGHSQRRAFHIKSNGFAGVVHSECAAVLLGTQKGAIGDDQSARVGVVSFSSHRYSCFGGTGLEHSCVDQRLQRVGRVYGDFILQSHGFVTDFGGYTVCIQSQFRDRQQRHAALQIRRGDGEGIILGGCVRVGGGGSIPGRCVRVGGGGSILGRCVRIGGRDSIPGRCVRVSGGGSIPGRCVRVGGRGSIPGRCVRVSGFVRIRIEVCVPCRVADDDIPICCDYIPCRSGTVRNGHRTLGVYGHRLNKGTGHHAGSQQPCRNPLCTFLHTNHSSISFLLWGDFLTF